MEGIQPSSCARTREWISFALDSELSDFERFLMEHHVERCADCSLFERDTRLIAEGMRSTSLESPSTPVTVGRLQQPARRFGRLRVANALPVAVAAAAMVLATTFTPDRAGLVGANEPTLESSASPATTNELVLEVRRRNLQQQSRNLRQQSLPAVRRVVSDIGAVTAQLSGPTN
jgi:predicted anti-sigma-YlaC factor YlaD